MRAADQGRGEGRALGPRLDLLAAAALFSTGGAAIKAVHFGGWPVACARSSIAALTLLVLVPRVRRRPTWAMLGVACFYAVTMVLFVLANKLTTAASTIYLQATAPLFVLLLGPWLLHERSRRGDLASMAAIAVGLVLLVTGLPAPSATAPEPLRGNLLAAVTGLTWALTILGMRGLGRAAAPVPAGATGGNAEPGPLPSGPSGAAAAAGAAPRSGAAEPAPGPAAGTATEPATRQAEAIVAAFWGNVLAAAVALPWSLRSLPLPESRPTDWLIVAFLGICQIALAYILLTRGIGRVPALEASLLLMLEPVLSPLWAWLIHSERPGARVLAGGALILAATLLNSWSSSRRPGVAAGMDGAPEPRPPA